MAPKGGTPFPLETLVVNVLGCLVAGMLTGSTFSAFGYETFSLLRDGLRGVAFASAAL